MTDTIAALPVRVDLRLYRGDDFGPLEFIREQPPGTAVDLTGYLITAQIRQSKDATDVLASFTCLITDGPGGAFTIALSAAQTAALPDNAFWDLQLKEPGPTGHTRTHAAGKVHNARDVTRSV